MKIRYIILALSLVLSTNIFSKGIEKLNKSGDKDNLEVPANLESWLAGQIIPGGVLMVYFNISQDEFTEYVTSNNLTFFDIEFAKKSINGDIFQSLDEITISGFNSGFDAESWTYQIENVDTTNWQYYARIYNLDTGKCPDLSLIPIVEDAPVVEEEEGLPITLPDYTCGEDYTYNVITNQNPLVSAASGEVFFIGGMPVLLEIINGGNGTFSGTGIIPVPFGNKTVQVTFNNVQVNDEYVVYQGNMTAVADDPANYPDFTPDAGPLNIGGDICLPPPPPPGYDSDGVNQVTGLNDWGFDLETGLHSGTNSPYDPNGFDVNGIHISTGTEYNDQGCNREGYTADGEICDPSGGPNPQAQAFAQENADSLRLQIMNLISGIQTELTDSLAQLDCAGIKNQMEVLLTTLGFDRDFIFGANDRYVNENMHLEFSEAPKPIILNANRDANVELLESKHITLYQCDKTKYKLNALLTALNNLVNAGSIADDILESISNWTQYEFNLYSNDPEKLEAWIINQIGDLMWTESGLSDDYATIEKIPKNLHNPYPADFLKSAFEINQDVRYHNAIASIDHFSAYNNDVSLQEVSSFFMRGDHAINGLDRAFYLEELAKQQTSAYFTENADNLLPLKIEKTIGNKTYTIYLDGIEFSPNGAILDAYIIITDPETGKKLVFRALDVSFGPTGVQSESRLYLAGDVEIRLNNAAMLVLKGTENTYVAWDCEGFSSMGVDAEIEFCRDFITPLDPVSLEPLADSIRYRLALAVENIDSWLEFYVVVNAPPFAVTQYPDVKWSLTNMVLDFSSTETPQFAPLPGYESPFWDGQNMSPLWKGFFVEDLTATLPNSFGNGSQPITASAFNILIDGGGFTGGVAVGNVLSIEDGNMAGWPISIEDFELRILNNQFAGAGIGGQIKVPVFEEAMDYEAVMYPGNEISFSVSPLTNATMDMFLATVEINADSEIKIGKINGEFVAVATLNGKMLVNTANGSDTPINLEVPDITFQGFQVSNQAPYFSPGNWGMNTSGDGVELGFNGFSINLSNIKPYNAGVGRAGVGFNIAINLVDALDISAAGSFGIEGMLEVNNNGQQRWVYDRVKVNEIGIDASFPGVEIKGIMGWYGNSGVPDPLWGVGFRGLLDAKFKGFDLELKAATQFGKKDDYKYFFVDALAELGSGIGTGAIQLKGFGGGVSYHMDVNQTTVNIVNESSNFALPPLGVALSGTVYTPDKNIGLGLKATALIATMKEEVFNGTVSLVFVFNANNGLNKISLQGTGQFLEKLDFGILPDFVPEAVTPPGGNAKLKAFIDLTFNFDEPSFHGSLNVFLNAGPLQGAGAGGKMVDAELHFDPTQWYIYIGRPEEGQRCGIIFELPIIGSLEATAYLDVGTNVPPMPALPDNVQEIAYLVNNNASLRSSGAGFVFGASLNFTIGAKIAGIVTAQLSAGTGFDMMLRKYEGLSCQGSAEPVGINGWYASGQMWAYVNGELSVFGVNVLSAGIAAVLQARLPNPFWAQATVGVKVKILFKTVTKSLKLELGENCILVSNDPSNEVGMEVITHLEPFDGAAEVETNATPKAYFALAVNTNYTMPDLNGTEHTYRVSVGNTSLTSSQGYEISHTVEISPEGNLLTIIPYSTYPANDTITFEVTAIINKNGSFLAEETKSIAFKTGQALEYIPEENVSASYPVNGMANFYKEEYNRHEGYIKLITGQANLLLNVPAGKVQKVRFTSSTGAVHYEDYEYNVFSRELTFPMTPAKFPTEQLYKMEIVRLDQGGNFSDETSSSNGLLGAALSSAGSSQESPPDNDPDNSDTAIESEPVLYSLYFRVSKYETFMDKMEEVTSVPNSNKMVFSLADYEVFDILEIKGLGTNDPLIRFTADLNNNWMDYDIIPAFEALEAFLFDLDISVDDLKTEVGVPKVNGSLILKESNFLSGSINMNVLQGLRYYVPASANQLFDEANAGSAAQIATAITIDMVEECAINVNSPECLTLTAALEQLEAGLPVIRPGSYPVYVKYKLPGGAVTSNTTITFVKNNN